ncbi:NAD(P)H-hydrate dehydratase [Thermicanus aegyptius]|uniref:NAD(P)H-hydrate dehydratase n=1 Tax=Thermicanus aegyptius TaxID=94009 RepID=UPI00146FC87D|nr:NAD(P)H-hydrate dehydratase [Thermicanus aegyptius]
MFLLTAQTMRLMDRFTIEQVGIPSLVLMENAGRAVAEEVKKEVEPEKRILILCGSGNNGGDGMVAARHLMNGGYRVKVWLAGEKEGSEEAKMEREILERGGYPYERIPGRETQFFHDLSQTDLLVDALFGIGMTREITGRMREWMEKIVTYLPPRVLAVDIPSGIGADDGKIYGIAIPAKKTVTFGYPKWGHFLQEGARFTGELVIADISIPHSVDQRLPNDPGNPRSEIDELLTAAEIKSLFPSSDRFTHKGSYGHVFIVGGSRYYPGASMLAAMAALKAGAGLVTLGVPASLVSSMAAFSPDPTYLPLPEEEGHLKEEAWAAVLNEAENFSVLAVGPGLSRWEEGTKGIAKLVQECSTPLILDADALNLLARDPSILHGKKGEVLLTPHPGEMARLTGRTVAEIEGDRPGWARRFALQYGVLLLLKGSYPLIATPSGKIYLNPKGSAALSKGGSGDVLTGLIAGFMAQKHNLLESTLLASYLHGVIGEKMMAKGGRTLLSSEILSFVAEVMQEHRTL